MESMNCMNEMCRTVSSEWKKGWNLKSGGFAMLCYSCGSAYENAVFCETFHSSESGWRKCMICGKRIHCGCIASRNLHEYMDFGGVGCVSCANRLHPVQSMQIPVDIPNGTFIINGTRDHHPMVVENRIDDANFSTEKLLQLTNAIGANDVNSPFDQLKREEPIFQTGESSKCFPNVTQQQGLSPAFVIKPEKFRPKHGVRDMYEASALAKSSINYTLATSLNSPSPVLPFPVVGVEGTEQNKGGSIPQRQRTRPLMPKPPKPSPAVGPETNKGSVSQTRIARPPAEGRGRSQLLPRYWPKITDQELQQLSGDLKSTIVPLFEKILSASDAGRIGRLVLPKACAEAYFPAINQSEGIPIRIQDIRGNEWTFQFRFWPNNNSRMYVLEGVTPCIQNMQLEAGDTVTFSRIHPGGQLVIGCRKATNNADMQDSQTSYIPNGDSPGETSFTGVNDNSNVGRTFDERPMAISEKKRARNIKNKRLLMHNDDAMELRLTWEEAQDLFRPSPSSAPIVVMIEDHEFEEFEEPPVFGKRTIFIARPSGEHEQLAQCDSCLKWRRLPPHALLSVKWTCADNIWDPNRSICSAPVDINPRNLESSFHINKESKHRRISDNKSSREGEPSGLDALATAAVLGDNMGEIVESSIEATTTRHPRHRPGCTCIVCIQPPSGKGKHEPTCKCNVCLTVKRRFKTLMMRKKKRQLEREAEIAQERAKIIGLEAENIAAHELLSINENLEDTNKVVELDLNCDPHREDDMFATLMNAATTLPFDGMFLEQNEGLVSHIKENVADEGGGFSFGNVDLENNLGKVDLENNLGKVEQENNLQEG